MATYSTPGVYIEEIPVFPPSVAPVATAIPAFIGYTERAVDRQGKSLTKVPTRLESLKEYEQVFGTGLLDEVTINIATKTSPDNALLDVVVGWDQTSGHPFVPTRMLYPELQLYFANGGGPCYVYSIGDLDDAMKASDFVAGIKAFETVDEPTLLLFPDAVLLSTHEDYGEVVKQALESCHRMQDRFAIVDVADAIPDTDTVADNVDTAGEITKKFRENISSQVEHLKYGAAYFPYVETLIPLRLSDATVKVKSYKETKVAANGDESDGETDADTTLAKLKFKVEQTELYRHVDAFLRRARLTLPPSGAVAGVYAKVDRTRGVWRAPANVDLSLVSRPAITITNAFQDLLNIDPTAGKSVNAIRSFYGKGTLIWGARTLAGNDNEWRYINVRRFVSFVEESVQKALGRFVFEPNDANTWVRVRSMIENFLINQWRDGALMGAKPEHAFRCAVGIGQTMSPQHVIDGYMIVEVYLAIVRPAEFIVLKFMQKMPES